MFSGCNKISTKRYKFTFYQDSVPKFQVCWLIFQLVGNHFPQWSQDKLGVSDQSGVREWSKVIIVIGTDRVREWNSVLHLKRKQIFVIQLVT